MTNPNTTTTITSDSITKRTTLRAPQSRVWRAISDSQEFGTWFGMVLEGPFVEGQSIFGRVLYPGYEHLRLEMKVEKIQPETYLSYRWHPYAVKADVDYSQEPMTLVEFTLKEEGDVTHLTVVESGFDKLSPERRDESYPMNDGGWDEQVKNITEHIHGNL